MQQSPRPSEESPGGLEKDAFWGLPIISSARRQRS
jgi:hypothetical protein